MSGPLDTRLDRRLFLKRMSALTAAAGLGSTGLAGGVAAQGDAGAAGRPVRLPESPRPQATRPEEFSLAEAAHAIRAGDLSPLELVEACLDRIHEHDGVYMAFNTVLREEALEQARALTEALGRGGAPHGALHGIPLAIKDNFYTAGVLTTANSHIFADFLPEYDGTAWARLQASGAVLLGKTQMGPLATTPATTPDGDRTTANAWAPFIPEVSPGGSSSGSATSVAARMALSSTGTQTGGSITNPSAAQGLTGLKPTMGRISLHGIIPLTYTRDHPGPLARDAMDAAVMVQTMAGVDPADPRTFGQPPVPDLVEAATPLERGGRPVLRWPTTIGVIPGYLERQQLSSFGRSQPDATNVEERREQFRIRQDAEIEARRRMLATMEDLGARVVEVDLPEHWETLTSSSFNNVRLPERSEPFMQYLKEDVRQFGVSLSPWINGLLLDGTEYLRGQRAKLLLLERVLNDLFAQCDVVVQTQPFPFDMIGLPLIAFPTGIESESRGVPLPTSAMFGGQPWAEDRLLSVVAAYQSVTDWHRQRPADPDQNQGVDPGEQGHGGGAAGGTAGAAPLLRAGGAFGRGRIDASEVMDLGQ